jgi:L-ascorbate metabolism protein UlaG (beta-lactamase superfamily)
MRAIAMLGPARYIAQFGRPHRSGQVFGISVDVAGSTFYHQGSANLIDDALRLRGVDVLLAGVAGRGSTAGYWRRLLGLLAPQTVIPTHHDDFFRPLNAEMGSTTNINLSPAPAPEEIRAVSRDIHVAALPLLGAGG